MTPNLAILNLSWTASTPDCIAWSPPSRSSSVIKELLMVIVVFTSRDANDGKDHKERGGEDRAKHENPDIDVVDPIMVPSVDADRNDNEAGEESINLVVDTLEVSIEDVELFALVPMDCSSIED
uniref:Uncharacterized protein n=1 Tax=Cucumis melo TaxID=3656 RepID=A0A9I9CXU8_CUCME